MELLWTYCFGDVGHFFFRIGIITADNDNCSSQTGLRGLGKGSCRGGIKRFHYALCGKQSRDVFTRWSARRISQLKRTDRDNIVGSIDNDLPAIALQFGSYIRQLCPENGDK